MQLYRRPGILAVMGKLTALAALQCRFYSTYKVVCKVLNAKLTTTQPLNNFIHSVVPASLKLFVRNSRHCGYTANKT